MGLFWSRLFNRKRYPVCPQDYMDQLRHKLTKGQIQYLYNRFCLFAGVSESGNEHPPKYLQKWNFYNGVLQMNSLLPTILNCMFADRNVINFVDFANFLSIFQAHSLKTKQEEKNENINIKLHLLFSMYDQNKDGRITKTDLVIVAHKLLSHLLNPRQIMNIVDTVMLEMDSKKNHQINFNDFCEAFEAFDMSEMMVINIPEFHDRGGGGGGLDKHNEIL